VRILELEEDALIREVRLQEPASRRGDSNRERPFICLEDDDVLELVAVFAAHGDFAAGN
jgi:hypothetical protein